MASRRMVIVAVTNDALADQDIRSVDVPSVVNLWASAANVDDQIGLRLDKTIIMDDGIMNLSAAATGMVDTDRDQLVFESVVGPGRLRLPIPILTASLQFMISVEPIL